MELVPLTPRLTFPMPEKVHGATTIGTSMVLDDPHGRWRVSSYGAQTWPSLLRPLLQWLHDQRFDVEKHFPKQIYLFWKVLNQKGDFVAEEESTEWRQFNVLSSRRLCFPTILTGSMSLRTSTSIWPNAFALSIVVWLLCYVYRHRQWQVTPKP